MDYFTCLLPISNKVFIVFIENTPFISLSKLISILLLKWKFIVEFETFTFPEIRSFKYRKLKTYAFQQIVKKIIP